MPIYNETEQTCEDCGTEPGSRHSEKCNVHVERALDSVQFEPNVEVK